MPSINARKGNAPSGKTIDRPHWKAVAQAQIAQINEMAARIETLQKNGVGTAEAARIRADAFKMGFDAGFKMGIGETK